ncbi:MAG: helix-turn-helix domain-containing protein [Anaerolineales bacterium]|nr:helix-turn-helix domain-containing protein [Anaerolineales bacterium]
MTEKPPPAVPGLTGSDAAQKPVNPPSQGTIDAILLSLKAVEQGLHKPIRVADLADAAGYSLFHFTRLFNRTLHFSPYDYLIRRRLSEAARDLQNPNVRILDIALKYQFGSHESFSRAFKRMFGMPPSGCRECGPDPHLVLDPVGGEMLHFMHSGPLVIESRTLPQLRLTGLMTHTGEPGDQPGALWEHLACLLDSAGSEPAPVQCCTLRLYPPGWKIHGLQIMAAVLLNETPALHPSLVEKTLPSGTWVSIQPPASTTSAKLLRSYLYQIWLPGMRFQLRLPLELEMHSGIPIRLSPPAERSQELLVPITAT